MKFAAPSFAKKLKSRFFCAIIILNTNKIKEKICAEIAYKPVFNSHKIVGLIFSKF